MQATFEIDSDTGGFLLLDPEAVPDLGDDFPACLNVLFDPEGQTCATDDYPDQRWDDVWSNEAEYLRTFDHQDRLFLTIADEGTLFVRVQDEPLTSEEQKRVLENFSGRLRVRGGRLAVVSGMTFFDESPITEDQTVAVPDGAYHLTLHHLRRHPSLAQAVGRFGSDEWPVAIAVLTPDGPTSEAIPPNLARFDTTLWGTELEAGSLCRGTVTQVVGPTVTVALHLTQHVQSGRATIQVLGRRPLTVGDDVMVYLESRQGNSWTARLVET